MFDQLQTNSEPPWAGRLWYGSIFGVMCVLGAAGVVLSFMKHGNFRFVEGPCYFAVLALALHSFLVAMIANPPMEKLSLRMKVLTGLVLLPWMVRLFLE